MKHIRVDRSPLGTDIITVDDVKTFGRISTGSEDALIQQFIKMAIPIAEDYLQRQLNTEVNYTIIASKANEKDNTLKLKYAGSAFSNITAVADSGNTLTLTEKTSKGVLVIQGMESDDTVLVEYTAIDVVNTAYKTGVMSLVYEMYVRRAYLEVGDVHLTAKMAQEYLKKYVQGNMLI